MFNIPILDEYSAYIKLSFAIKVMTFLLNTAHQLEKLR